MKAKEHIAVKILYTFIMFFIICAFLVTCTTMLFVSILSKTLEIEMTLEILATAAKLTFLNVVFLSVLFTFIDLLRRHFTTDRTTKKIVLAAKQISDGDFSTRVSVHGMEVGTDFEKIAECFNLMAEELAGVETLKTDFISNVSHEMKTPLTVMQNYGMLLQEPGLSEEKRIEYAKGITAASRRLGDMVSNILKLNRLETKQIYPKPDKYDLGEQLCECILSYEPVWEAKNIELDTNIEDNVIVEADGELLSLVWNNLLSNAFKFTEPGGKVGISLKKDDSWATVIVSDTGCGMTPEVGAHIFDKFYQGDSSHTTEGNGLGLALVKRVIDILQGEIYVESILGEGSNFCVRIKI